MVWLTLIRVPWLDATVGPTVCGGMMAVRCGWRYILPLRLNVTFGAMSAPRKREKQHLCCCESRTTIMYLGKLDIAYLLFSYFPNPS